MKNVMNGLILNQYQIGIIDIIEWLQTKKLNSISLPVLFYTVHEAHDELNCSGLHYHSQDSCFFDQ